MPTNDALAYVAFARSSNEKNLQLKTGASSLALTMFEAVFTMNLKETAEQLPKNVGPSTAAVATGNGCMIVIVGSKVANISVGTFVLKNRWVGSKVNC